MSFAVIGVNHKNCPIKVREKVSLTHSKVLLSLHKLKEEQGISEVVMLSTCNRSEVYIYDEKIKEAKEKITAFYESYFEDGEITPFLFTYENEEAIEHLFRVTAGLDSIVIGEDQILGQVKKAHSDALEEHTSGKVLNKIFREAVSTAKQIKTALKISENPLSISRIAVKFLKEKRGSLKGKKILVIGTGQMNELTIKYLLEEETGPIYVTNRTHSKAVELSEVYEGLVSVPYEERYEMLKEVEVVISATASPHIILQEERMPQIHHQIDMMDIAMPRDIDEKINDREGICVYDIDDLKSISEASSSYRRQAAEKAEGMIKSDVQKLLKWLEALNVADVVQGLEAYCNEIRLHTGKLLSKKLNGKMLEDEDINLVMAEALKRCMRTPIAKLMSTEDKQERMRYAKVLAELFELN